LDTERLELSSLVDISAPKSHAASVAQGPIKPGLSSQIMPHVADLSVSKGERIEITLSPDELGRVRLSATQTEAGVVLVVQAERPETLDLMRRHMPDLLRDLQDMGFADINYSEGEQREHTEPNTSSTPETIEPQETPPPTQHVGSSGLDMRL
jgi:flagellar hook-length control protein FliK